MKITSGDGFVLHNGRTVRVGTVYDAYVSYNTETNVGLDPETRVRYSHWWSDERVIAPFDKPIDEFVEMIDERVPGDELPESKSPHKRRS